MEKITKQSAEGIVASKATKVLKPYIVPDSDKISLDAVPESIRNGMPEWRKHLFNPVNLAIHCIGMELLTARYSCMDANATQIYISSSLRSSVTLMLLYSIVR